MKLRRLPHLLLPLVAIFSFSSCLDDLTKQIERSVNLLEQAKTDLGADSTQWRGVIEKAANDLPEKTAAMIRNEVMQVAERTVADTGVEFKCSADFLRRRVHQDLDRLIQKLKLRGQEPDRLPPAFCHILPGTLNFNEPAASRQMFEIAGYDLDYPDPANKKLRLVLFSDANNKQIELPEARIGRTTHYIHSINTANNDFEQQCRTENISKIRVLWNNQPQGEVIVIPKKDPKIEIKEVPLTPISITPPHTEGDADFDTHDDEPMSYIAEAHTKIEGNKIVACVHLRAREERDDWTTVDGTTAWAPVFTPDPGWRIKSANPLGTSTRDGLINSHDDKDVELGSGEVARRFVIHGDHDGDDAGTYTSMTATFNSVRVELEEILP